ncbi:MAG: hypothetical protein ACYTFW_03265 [Planctomycetota bacterium]|jgi:hypothetical protein
MQSKQSYENFPIWVPLLSCALSLSIYILGAYIFSLLGILFTVLYLLFCLWVELRILKYSCVNCYYYGKTCGLGRGKLCALFFKKGNPEEFTKKEFSWKDLIPDFMVLIFPLVGGIIILIRDFTWLILVLMVILAILSLAGNAFIRGSLACKYCKQKELTGCPAEQLFNKQSKTACS